MSSITSLIVIRGSKKINEIILNMVFNSLGFSIQLLFLSLSMLILDLLLFIIVDRWKYLVFFSPKVIHLLLDFWNHNASSWRRMSVKSFTRSFSNNRRLWAKLVSWALWIPLIRPWIQRFFLKMFPNTFLFQSLAALVKLLMWSERFVPFQLISTIFSNYSLFPEGTSSRDLFASHPSSRVNL